MKCVRDKNSHVAKLTMHIYLIELIIILISFAVFICIINHNFRNQTKAHNLQYNLSAVRGIRESLVRQNGQMMEILKRAYEKEYQGEEVFGCLTEEGGTLADQVRIQQFLAANFISGNHLSALLVYSPVNRKTYSATNRYCGSYDGNAPEFGALRRAAAEGANKMEILPSAVYPTLGLSRSYAFVYCIRDINSYQTIGSIEADFGTEGLTELLAQSYPGVLGEFLVLNGDGEVLYSSEEEWYGTVLSVENYLREDGNGEVKIGTDVYFYNRDSLAYPDIHILGLVPKKQVYRAISAAVASMTVVMAAAILVMCVLMYFVTNYRARYLKRIRAAMEKAQNGDLRAYIETDGRRRDELNDIAESFNGMLSELNRYIDRVYNSELNRQRYQLMALQAQINPHFLYNTFEAIRMKAVLEGEDEIADMIYILSKILRNSVKGEGILPIQSEVENCENYLRLHMIRYRGRLNYSIETDPGINEFVIVRQALQVMVENYIVHGLDGERQDNRIIIRGARDGDWIRITVSDNGTGIGEEELERIRKSFPEADSSPNEHIGLKNVYQRMAIVFGDRFEMTIASEPDRGTEICLRFPARSGKEET